MLNTTKIGYFVLITDDIELLLSGYVWIIFTWFLRDVWGCAVFVQSFSYLFLYPVDTTFPEQANYYEVIKRPMDLSTVKVGHNLYELDWSYRYRFVWLSVQIEGK